MKAPFSEKARMVFSSPEGRRLLRENRGSLDGKSVNVNGKVYTINQVGSFSGSGRPDDTGQQLDSGASNQKENRGLVVELDVPRESNDDPAKYVSVDIMTLIKDFHEEMKVVLNDRQRAELAVTMIEVCNYLNRSLLEQKMSHEKEHGILKALDLVRAAILKYGFDPDASPDNVLGRFEGKGNAVSFLSVRYNLPPALLSLS